MDMLLDYASDDDDDDTAPAAARAPAPAAASSSASVTPAVAAAPPPASVPAPSLLPSAAELFDAPSASSTKKRPQVNGSAHPSQHQPKVARSGSSSSAAARTPPGATLVPPQLRGRSNVATEDLDKLFVQRQQRRSE